ncbi:unnamed protein product, partial [Effrenium voratum]
MATHKDHMVRTSARTAYLCLLRLENDQVRNATIEVTHAQEIPRLTDSLRASWASMTLAVQRGERDSFRAALELEEDTLAHIGELLQLRMPELTEAVASVVISEALLPRVFGIAEASEEHGSLPQFLLAEPWQPHSMQDEISMPRWQDMGTTHQPLKMALAVR